MTPLKPTGRSNDIEPIIFGLPGFDITWAGEGPPDHFYFGSDDGRLWLSQVDKPLENIIPPVAPSREAINGVAFANRTIALATRDDITFYRLDQHKDDYELTTFPAGAHGVVATDSGRFFAPLGTDGLFASVAGSTGLPVAQIIKDRERNLHVYKVALLGSQGDKDVIACAARRDGLAIVLDSGASASISRLESSHFDAVDVCPLGDPRHPHAVVALGVDGSIHMIRDVTKQSMPVSIRFDFTTGTAYRVLAAQGHLFVLTSEALITLPDFASRFLTGAALTGKVRFRKIDKLIAVDAEVAFDRWLLVVLPEGQVAAFEVAKLARENNPGEDARGPYLFNSVRGTIDRLRETTSLDVENAYFWNTSSACELRARAKIN
jgi:hypothetical protein